MTGLWTNDRDTLADALIINCPPLGSIWRGGDEVADRLIDTGAVRTLDLDETEIEHAAERLHKAVYGGVPWPMASYYIKARRRNTVRAVIESLRRP
jgi:hypothetical protein